MPMRHTEDVAQRIYDIAENEEKRIYRQFGPAGWPRREIDMIEQIQREFFCPEDIAFNVEETTHEREAPQSSPKNGLPQDAQQTQRSLG